MGLYKTDEKENGLKIGDRVRIKAEGIEGFITNNLLEFPMY